MSATIFGQSTDTTLRAANYFGQRGWFAVPCGYYSRVTGTRIEASPNADFSAPVYDCKRNGDGGLVFQSLALSVPDRC